MKHKNTKIVIFVHIGADFFTCHGT